MEQILAPQTDAKTFAFASLSILLLCRRYINLGLCCGWPHITNLGRRRTECNCFSRDYHSKFATMHLPHRIRIGQKGMQRSSLLVRGRNWFKSMPHKPFSTKMMKNKYWVEWMLWKNVQSYGSHHTKPPASQNGCSSKNFSSNHPCR